VAGAPGLKVCVVGAAGGIGQPLALLLKLSPRVHTLHLYDVVNTAGVKADISHINTTARVRAFTGPAQLADALSGCDLVVIPAGVPRKPGMTRDDLFNINAGIVKSVCEVIVKACPCAIVNIISNPVNSTVPIAAETFKKFGVYDARRLFGAHEAVLPISWNGCTHPARARRRHAPGRHARPHVRGGGDGCRP
jgi:malate dehydrogenase